MKWNELFVKYLQRALSNGITKASIAQSLEIQPQLINKLENGTYKPSSPEQVETIANKLQLSFEEKEEFLFSALEFIKSDKIKSFEEKIINTNSVSQPLFQPRKRISGFCGISNSIEDVKKIPVIDWVKASSFSTINDPYLPGYASKWLETTRKGNHLFALRVNGNCMEPEFKDGEYIIVNPEIEAVNNDYVVVADREANEATFKQLKIYGDQTILHPLNPTCADIILDKSERYRIVGRVVEKVKRY